MIFGYGRCSTNESKQDINRQIRELKQHGAKEVFFEYEHGDSAIKPQLELLLDTVNEGDTIITTEVSRLARSTKQLCEIIDKVKEKKICLDIIGSIKVDYTSGSVDPMTNAFIQMSGVFSELELMVIRERVKSGMANAKAKGRKIGRPTTTKKDIPDIFYKHYPSYLNGSLNISEFARVCGLSRSSIYKYTSLMEKNDEKNNNKNIKL